MGSYTDEEIIKQNRDIEDIVRLADEMWVEVLDFAFVSNMTSEQRFRKLKDIEYIYEDLVREIGRLKWEPYDTPQTAVDIIGQK